MRPARGVRMRPPLLRELSGSPPDRRDRAVAPSAYGAATERLDLDRAADTTAGRKLARPAKRAGQLRVVTMVGAATAAYDVQRGPARLELRVILAELKRVAGIELGRCVELCMAAARCVGPKPAESGAAAL